VRPVVLALALCLVPGCTDAQGRAAIDTIKTAIPWVCGGAKKICEALGDAEACAAIALVCDVGETVIGTVPPATSGGESDGVISEEP